MDITKGTIPITLAASIVAGAFGAGGSYWAINGRIDVLNERVQQLQGAKDEALAQRVGVIEKKLDETVNTKSIGDWHGWRSEVDSDLKRDREIMFNQEQEITKLQVNREEIRKRFQNLEQMQYKLQSKIELIEAKQK